MEGPLKGIGSIFLLGSVAWVDTQLGVSGQAASLPSLTPRLAGRFEVMLRPNKPIKDKVITVSRFRVILAKESRCRAVALMEDLSGIEFISRLFQNCEERFFFDCQNRIVFAVTIENNLIQ